MTARMPWIPGLIAVLLAACSDPDEPAESANAAGESAASRSNIVVMRDDLKQLQDDFNANEGRVRLIFLNGPTCGICLRGMADLNDEFIAASQHDDRLVTFVVHVPTMGAKQHHAVDSMPLLDGPRVHHYWEESGIIGQHYAEVMDVDMYVWDFWAIYGPDVTWTGTLPPVPDYYEHQLGVTSGRFRGFPKERVLDAGRFAARTYEYLLHVDSGRFAGDVAIGLSERERLADGTVIPHVGQPRNVAVRQHIMGRGGYRNLKRIQSYEARGRIEANGASQPLVVRAERPNILRRTVGEARAASVAVRDADGIVTIPAAGNRGLPAEIEHELLASFEFDGLFVEWPDKGHQVDMRGMQKFGDVLAWQLDLRQNGGHHWHLYLDSHTGDLVRASLLNADRQPGFIIDQRDFRETAGIRFPHRIDYLGGTGEPLASETFDEILVDIVPFELEQQPVSH